MERERNQLEQTAASSTRQLAMMRSDLEQVQRAALYMMAKVSDMLGPNDSMVFSILEQVRKSHLFFFLLLYGFSLTNNPKVSS